MAREKERNAIHQAILDQFYLEPQPNRDNALKEVRKLNLGKIEPKTFERRRFVKEGA
jgi:hypothetical protein